MAGGPINGSGFFGPTVLKDNPASTIIIRTVLQIASDVVDTFTHLTCVYDKYWYNRQDLMTFPIAFYYVTGFHEISRTDTSKKRVILYEPQAKLTPSQFSDPLRPGVQEVIVDNAVKQPRTYQLDIVVPFQPISKQFGRTVREFTSMIDSFSEVFVGAPILEPFAFAQEIMALVSKAIDIAAKFPSNNAANYINKNSLDAMWESQHTVTMKWWTGYDYKYVLIDGLDITKKGTEDDVFRGTMTVTEMPVLTVTPVVGAKDPASVDRNWAATAVSTLNNLLFALPIQLTQVKQASGDTDVLQKISGAGVSF